MFGHSSGQALGAAEQAVGQAPLKRAERWAVNRVDDFWHAGAPGGQAPDEAGFAAVRVHDVRPERLEPALELPVGKIVAQRPDGPDEFGDAVKQSVDVFNERLE